MSADRTAGLTIANELDQGISVLVRWRCLTRLNRLRTLRQIDWRELLPIALAAPILCFYGTFWLQSLINELAALRLVQPIILARALSTFCLLIGVLAGVLASSSDRAAIDRPWLAVLPWTPAARRTVLALSLISRVVTGSLAILMLLMFVHVLSGSRDPWTLALIGTAQYGAGFSAGCFLHVMGCHMRAKLPVRPLRRSIRPTAAPFAWFDRAAPRWAGSWGLAPRIGRTLATGIASLVAGLSVADAAASGAHPITLAPGVASLGPLMIMIAALRCTPLLSPVLRTTSLGYSRASLAMVRLPALLAASWFAMFSASALALHLVRLRAMAPVCVIALLLALGYTLTALSTPRSPRLALTFFAIAVALASDQYATLQNFVFPILFGLLLFFVVRARARFRGTH